MNTQEIIDFIAGGFLAELGTRQEFERSREMSEKEMLAVEEELNAGRMERTEKDEIRFMRGE